MDSSSRADRPEESSTRGLETSRGILSYSEVADIVAGHLRELLDKVVAGAYSSEPIDENLLRGFHGAILERILPDIAGRWRTKDVKVGSHVPPRYYEVPVLITKDPQPLRAFWNDRLTMGI